MFQLILCVKIYNVLIETQIVVSLYAFITASTRDHFFPAKYWFAGAAYYNFTLPVRTATNRVRRKNLDTTVRYNNNNNIQEENE